MSLREYRRRRRFDKTPEPEPEAEPRGAGTSRRKKERLNEQPGPAVAATPKPGREALEGWRPGGRFVIQKHDARNIHYDLRLEMEGVLKSWACPKGLATPHDRRKLAVHVEDHPLSYIDFEGEIPEGEYGAGRVQVWDSGEYACWGDPASALEKGALTVLLDGKKVKGEFSLVHMKNRGENWLVLLNKDDRLDTDLREAGRKEPMPRRIKPMQSVTVDEAFDSPDFIFEIKYDGVRAMTYLDAGGNLSVMSRNQREQLFRYPELADLGELLLAHEAVIDGEIVALDEEGISRFQLLQNRMGLSRPVEISQASRTTPVNYIVFDILYLDGRDLVHLPMMERKRILERVMIPHRFLRISEWIDTGGRGFFAAARELGLEGIMAKRKQSLYRQRRTRDWLKIKAVGEQEFVICGFTDPGGGRAWFGALLLGIYEGKDLVYAGHVGTGFTEETLESLYKAMRPLEQPEPPFREPPPATRQKSHWIRPQLIAEVKFTEWTREGYLRHPSFLGLRDDIEPFQVVREQARKAG